MPIRFFCPACYKKLSIGSRRAGTSVACPRCKGEVVVPPESTAHLRPARADRFPVAQPAGPPPARNAPSSPWRHRLRGTAVAAVLLAVAAGPASVARVPSAADAPGPEAVQARPDPPARGEEPPPIILPLEQVAAAAAPQGTEDRAEAPRPPAAVLTTDARPPARERAAPAVTEARPARAPTHKELAVAVAKRWDHKRRSQRTDEELRRQLLLVPEVGLDAVPGSSKNLLAASARVASTGLDLVPAVMARRPDLMGLRPRVGNDARLSREEALNLNVLSQHLRRHVETSMPGIKEGVLDLRPDAKTLRDRLLDNADRRVWLRPEAIPALRQLLMHEHRHVRLILVEALAEIPGPQASLALAERAVFDLHPEVRRAAVAALVGRPAGEYEPALLAAFRYPWPAVADHAAEALVALDRREAVPKLIPLLDARDPAEPFPVEVGKKRQPMVPELVRLNHLRNCLLCHPPSFSPADPGRGLVPNSGQPLPLPSSGPRTVVAQDSGSRPGAGGGGYGGSGGAGTSSGGGTTVTVGKGKTVTLTTVFTFVRTDITYLKQDFSLLQPVPNHGRLWPADQRFDYMVRLRPLDPKEMRLWQDTLKDFRAATPQREALLYALRELTGENPGPTAADWKRLYSPVTGQRLAEPLDAEGQELHLRDALTEAPPRRQAELLILYKDQGGPAYDRALGSALPSLTAELHKPARAILADRMYCLPVKELRQRLGDADPEVRRAAALACRQRSEKALAPDLIARLDDGHAEVSRQALEALRHLSGHDFGPAANAGPDQRRQAVAAWLGWWERQEGRRAGAK